MQNILDGTAFFVFHKLAITVDAKRDTSTKMSMIWMDGTREKMPGLVQIKPRETVLIIFYRFARTISAKRDSGIENVVTLLSRCSKKDVTLLPEMG